MISARALTVSLLCLLVWNISCYAESEFEFKIGGWTEAVVSVRNIDAYHVFFKDVAGWRSIKDGVVSRKQLDAWQQPEGVSAIYRVYGNPGAESGFIRLVQFAGVKRTPIRVDSQSWDTGGIFDINVRVKNLERMAEKVRALGWQARSPVTQFSFGKFVVKEWIVQSPDGLAIAMIERIAPPLEGWPHLKSISRTFNSTQVVSSMQESLDFYERILGFKRYMEHKGVSAKPAANVLGLPHNLSTTVPRRVYILHPDGTNDGSVELLSFEGATGSDYSHRSVMPNLGIAMLRFPVVNIERLKRRLEQQNVTKVHRLTEIDGLNKLTITAPEGAWLEFYEPAQR